MTLGGGGGSPACIILSRVRAESIFFCILPPCSRIHIMYDFFHGRKAMVKTGGEGGGGGLVVRRSGVHRPVRAAEHAGVLRLEGRVRGAVGKVDRGRGGVACAFPSPRLTPPRGQCTGQWLPRAAASFSRGHGSICRWIYTILPVRNV